MAKKRTPKKAEKKEPARRPVNKRTPKNADQVKTVAPTAKELKAYAKAQQSVTVTTKKAPKKVPEPKVKTGGGFLPGNRKALRKERKDEMKKVAFDALTPAQQAKRLRDNIRKKKNSLNARSSAGKAGNSANTGTRPSAKGFSTTQKRTAKETGVARVRKATTTKSASAKGKQKAVPARNVVASRR